jgi:hypothetical protein
VTRSSTTTRLLTKSPTRRAFTSSSRSRNLQPSSFGGSLRNSRGYSQRSRDLIDHHRISPSRKGTSARSSCVGPHTTFRGCRKRETRLLGSHLRDIMEPRPASWIGPDRCTWQPSSPHLRLGRIDQKALKRRAVGVLRRDHNLTWEEFVSRGSNFEAAFICPDRSATPFVAPLEPFETNERMIIQQGLFLAATCLDMSFQHVLAHTIMAADCRLFRAQIYPAARIELLSLLDKMNISEATLFPGIDGFARSLWVSARLRKRFMLEENQPLPWRV